MAENLGVASMDIKAQDVVDFLYELGGFMSILFGIIVVLSIIMAGFSIESPSLVDTIFYLVTPFLYGFILASMNIYGGDTALVNRKSLLTAAVTFIAGGLIEIVFFHWLAINSAELGFALLLLGMSLATVVVKRMLT